MGTLEGVNMRQTHTAALLTLLCAASISAGFCKNSTLPSALSENGTLMAQSPNATQQIQQQGGNGWNVPPNAAAGSVDPNYGQRIDGSAAMSPVGMVVTTTDSVDGYRIKEYRGIVRGVMVREPNTIQNFKAGFQGIFGGKIGAYIKNCEQGRQAAYDSMVREAQTRGANAIVGVRYDSDAFQGGGNDFGTEVVCYGTAVLVEARP